MDKATAAAAAKVLFSIFLVSITTQAAIAKTQSEALSQVYQLKLKNKAGGIDTSEFDASHIQYIFDEAKVEAQVGLKEKDRIERLPGQPQPVEFKQYGGYVTVDRSAGRALYYYFVEKRQQLPLLLWLNGGPGCSSLGYGAFQELGPFRVNSDGKTLFQNPFAWNKAANVLFWESPAGVGFSYSNTTADYTASGDRRTALDNYVFLLNWLERFPEYKNTDIYISGESYAGHYVPQFAHTILHHNLKAKKPKINLKGIIIGNAVINDETDLQGMYEYFGSHALVSDETTATIMTYCDFSPSSTSQSDKCEDAASEASENIDSLNIYNIYAPVCLNSNLTNEPKPASIDRMDPCSEYYVSAYLNRDEVQKALHANVTKIPYMWRGCSHVLKKWQDSPLTILPLLKEFMSNGIRVWIYSGDTDGRIPVTSTKLSIKKMNLPIKTSWHPWYLDGQVVGYTQVYERNLTFATIKGAGHQVPSYTPAAALSLIVHFLAGENLPKSS